MTPLMAANFAVLSSNYAFVALVGALAHTLSLHAWQLGLVIAMVGVMWVASAPRWGRLAPRLGHVAALRRALAGVAISFGLLAAYVHWALGQTVLPGAGVSLGLLLLTRVAAGAFTAGVPVVCMGWIASRTAPAARAAVMARYGAAGAVGMVVAPPVVGWLGSFGLSAPLWLAALLPLVPLVLLNRLPAAPTGNAAAPTKGPTLRPFDKRIRAAWFSALALYSVVIIANVCIGFYLIDELGATSAGAAAATGTALGAAGLALMLSQTVVSRHPDVTPRAWLRAGAVLAALGFGSILFTTQPWMVAVCFFVAGCGMGLSFPSVSARAANGVQPHEQGACAGAMSIAQGASMVIAPVLGAGLYEWTPAAPFVLMAALLTAVLVGALRD